MKRSIALFMAIAIFCIALIGCGGTQSSTAENTESTKTVATGTEVKNQEPVKVKYVIPGNAPKDYDIVAKEINNKLLADGTGIELERVYIPWDVWEQKINLMLSTGEDFDLFHIMQDWIPFSSYYSKGALYDITDAVQKEGANLKKVVPENIWEGAKIDNKIYAVPTFWIELATEEGIITMRTDLLKQNNLEIPKNPDELLDCYEKIMKNWKGTGKAYLPMRGGTCDPIATHSTVLHRTYDSFPFVVRDSLFYVSQSGDVMSWIETPEFKRDCEFYRKAYKKGIINPDVLTVKQEQMWAPVSNGDWFTIFGTGGDITGIQKNNQNATKDDVTCTYFNPEKPYIRPLAIKNCNAVSSTSTHPEAAIKFLNWLWANQDNYDLYFYGIEGKHFKKTGEHSFEWIKDTATDSITYSDSDWMSGNINFLRYDSTNGLPAVNNALYTINDKAENSVAANFFFNATDVKAEYANVKTELAASIVPIALGVLDYDEAFKPALEKMKKAGLDKVVEAYKKQFNEWREKGGK